MKVFFIGAGPGDPELLTIKAEKIIRSADIIIYAGSLVNKQILKSARKDALIYNSAHMTFEDVTNIMLNEKHSDKVIARIHTGDPSLYGAIGEQLRWCGKHKIQTQVIPGVSSFCAAAAALKQELTLPGISQSVIITRISGRTKVPARESIKKLSQIRATLILFLSAGKIEDTVKELLHGYDGSTPASVVYKASWPGQKIIKGNLSTIASKLKKEKIDKHALIIVGDVLKNNNFELSMLYDKTFTHGCRKSK